MFESVKEEDLGFYICVVKNEYLILVLIDFFIEGNLSNGFG